MLEGVALEHRIGVDAEEVGVLGHVDTGVQGVPLAAVAFAHEHEGHGRASCFEDLLDGLAGEREAHGAVHRLHGEAFHESGGRCVGRAVVYHDDLVEAVVEPKQRFHRLHDGDLLVVGRHKNRDGHVELVLELVVNREHLVLVVQPPRPERYREKKIGGVDEQVEQEQDAGDCHQHREGAVHGRPPLRESA